MPKDDQTEDLFGADGADGADKAPVITKEVLEASERAARAEGEAAGLKEALKTKPVVKENKAAPEKEHTRQELRVMVNEGKITEDRMDEILDAQRDRKFDKKLAETVDRKLADNNTVRTTSDQIDRYVQAFPDINKAGSAVRDNVEKEYRELVSNGSPDTLATELAAIKIACGPLKTGAGRRAEPDSHEDVGTGGGDGGKPDTSGWAKGLSARQKTHYEKLILKGVYKGQTDPKLVKELSIARKAH